MKNIFVTYKQSGRNVTQLQQYQLNTQNIAQNSARDVKEWAKQNLALPTTAVLIDGVEADDDTTFTASSRVEVKQKDRITLPVTVYTSSPTGPNTMTTEDIEIYHLPDLLTVAMVKKEIQKKYPNCSIEVTRPYTTEYTTERHKTAHTLLDDSENIAHSAHFGGIEVCVTKNTTRQTPEVGEAETVVTPSAPVVTHHSPQTQPSWKLYFGVGALSGTAVGAITSTILAYTTDLSQELVFGIGIPSGFVLGLLTAGAAYYGVTRQTSLA